MANGDVGRSGGDVFAVLGWGLRRYAWLVALFVVSLGIVIPAFLDRVPDEYEAQAQVGPIEELNLPNLDPLPRLAESVFNNGAVAEAVRESYDPPLPRSRSVIPERVRLVAAQDNVVLTVVGRGSTPESAAEDANVAAAALTDELNKYSVPVGSFAVQRRATPPTRPVSNTGDALSIGLGVLAGLTAAVGAVGLLLAWRRPVLDVGSAEEVTGAPVLGRVWLGSSSDEARGLPQLCYQVLASGTHELLLTGSPGTSEERQLLTSALTSVLAGKRDVIVSDAISDQRAPHPTPEALHGPEPLVIVNAPSQARIATRSETSLTLLVVRVGTARSSLRRQVEQYLDDGAVGVVLVRKRGRLHSGWRRRSSKAATSGTALTPIARGKASDGLHPDHDSDTQPVGGQPLKSAPRPKIKEPRP